jgi:hypothetical protein
METLTDIPAIEKKSPAKRRFLFWLQEGLAISFWFYLIVKTFIFDFDIYLLERFAPDWTWIVYAKFPIILGILATVWFFTRNATMVKWLLYILFYPIILFFRTTWLMFKTRQWLLIIAAANAAMSLLRSVKYRFITGAFSFIALVAILVSHNRPLLIGATITLLTVLVLTFCRRFYYTLTPSALYQTHSKLISQLVNSSKSIYKPGDDAIALPLARMNESQLQNWTNQMQVLVLANRFCYFVSSKLKQYQRTNLSVASDLMNVFVLAGLTVLCFGLVNFALYKLNPGSFVVTDRPSVFLFYYYSTSRLFGQAIGEIVPIAAISRAIAVFETVTTFVLFGMLLSLFLSVKEKRDSEELDRAIALIKKQGAEMEGYIQTTYKLSVTNAINELNRMKAGFINVIVYLSNNIDTE